MLTGHFDQGFHALLYTSARLGSANGLFSHLQLFVHASAGVLKTQRFRFDPIHKNDSNPRKRIVAATRLNGGSLSGGG